jgi:hypothetical protein
MHPELHGLQRLRQRRLEPQQARPPVCQDTRQSGHRCAGLGGRNVRLRVIGSNDDMRARRDRLQPFDVHDLDRRLDERRDEVVGAAFREIRTSMTIQVTDRGVQAVRNFRHLAFDEIFLIERANAQGDVSLAAGEIETSRIVYQVDDNVRVPRAKSREQRSEDVVAEPGQTGHRDPALKTGITRGNARSIVCAALSISLSDSTNAAQSAVGDRPLTVRSKSFAPMRRSSPSSLRLTVG